MLWKQSACWSFDGRVHSICSLGGSRIAVSSESPASISVYDSVSRTRLLTIPNVSGDHLHSVCFSPDGKRLAYGSHDNIVTVFDSTNGNVIWKADIEIYVCSVCFSPDGATIFVVDGNGRYVVIDSTTGVLLQMEFVPFSHKICFSLSGGIMLIKCKNVIQVVNGASEPRTIDCWGVCSVSISSDGGIIIAGLENGEIHVIDTVSGQTARTIKAHQDWVNTVRISSDGSTFVSGSMDETIKVWSATTFDCLQTITDHREAIGSVNYGVNNCIVSCGADKTVRVWELC